MVSAYTDTNYFWLIHIGGVLVPHVTFAASASGTPWFLPPSPKIGT